MNQEEMRNEFHALYEMMANSNEVAFMHTFGMVQKEMMDWFIQNKPELAQDWIEKLESIKWHNYLTPKEADMIVSKMDPKAPWNREQWKAEMDKHGFETEKEPYFNSCALYVTMNMKMSDSGQTFREYIEADKLFAFVYKVAVDSLMDKDGKFSVRGYFLK